MNRIIGSWLHSCRLVLHEVREGGGEKLRAIAKQAKRSVAVRAQDSAYSPRAVVMVECQRPWVTAWSSATRAFANCACAALALKDSVVFGGLYAKFLAPMAVSGKPSRFFAVLLTPLRLFVTATRPTEALKAVHLTFAISKFSDRLNRFARSTPLHPVGRFRPTRSEVVMAAQVSKGLPLDPTKALSVPWSDLCRPSASALAKTKLGDGIHFSPPLFYQF